MQIHPVCSEYNRYFKKITKEDTVEANKQEQDKQTDINRKKYKKMVRNKHRCRDTQCSHTQKFHKRNETVKHYTYAKTQFKKALLCLLVLCQKTVFKVLWMCNIC